MSRSRNHGGRPKGATKHPDDAVVRRMFALSPDLDARLRARATVEGAALSAIVERALDRELRRHLVVAEPASPESNLGVGDEVITAMLKNVSEDVIQAWGCLVLAKEYRRLYQEGRVTAKETFLFISDEIARSYLMVCLGRLIDPTKAAFSLKYFLERAEHNQSHFRKALPKEVMRSVREYRQWLESIETFKYEVLTIRNKRIAHRDRKLDDAFPFPADTEANLAYLMELVNTYRRYHGEGEIDFSSEAANIRREMDAAFVKPSG